MISVDMGCGRIRSRMYRTHGIYLRKDSGGPYNYDVTSALAETAKEEGLDYAIDVYPHYGSDVEAIFGQDMISSWSGWPWGVCIT